MERLLIVNADDFGLSKGQNIDDGAGEWAGY